MTPEQYERLTQLFHAALEIAPEQRAAFLDRVSDGDAEFRRELESLLAAHERGTANWERPLVEMAAGLYLAQNDFSAEPVNALVPNSRLGRYQIRSLLGKGGMGEVYLAEDLSLHRKVALKILPAEVATNQERMRRFRQEATAAAALNHPHVAHIYEIGESEGTHFIALEYIDGETLREKIHRSKAPLEKLLKYLTQAADGLSKAHAAGIVHRDLKPDNIMITRDDYAKILDFGLAKLIEPQRPPGSVALGEVSTAIMAQFSMTGMVMGTAGYMSPEQAQGKVNEIDHRSDIFSFGCILFEAVTRHRPFADESVIKSLHKTAYEPAPPINDFNPSAPPDLQRIVRRCLAKDREDRYQTIKDVAIELKELSRELEVSASLIPASTAEAPSPNLETSNQPGVASTTALAASASTAGPTVTAGVSSAEYLLTGIKQHRRSALIALAALVAVTAAVAYFAYQHYAAGRGAGTIRSLAILPFVNTGGNPDTEYLADGIQDGLINSLSQLPNLTVRSGNSVLHYKGKETDARVVGKELGVQAVLTGRVAQRGDSLSISLELVNTDDNSHIWGAQYNRKLSELMAVSGDISQAVTENLRLKLSGEQKEQLSKRPTNNPEAYQAYLKGRYYSVSFAPGSFDQAIKYYSQAIDLEPNYAQAYAGLAFAHIKQAYAEVPPQVAMLKARPAVKRALELDETIADAHSALANINFDYDWDWPAAERELRRAIELNPGEAINHQNYGWALGLMGRFDEGLTELKHAQALDPLSTNINLAIGTNYYWSGQTDRAVEQYRKMIDFDPTLAGLTRFGLGDAYLKQGKFPEAIAELQKAGPFGVTLTATIGFAYGVSGNRAEAEKLRDQLQTLSTQKYVPPCDIALIYIGLDDKDQAFVWLEKGFAERSPWMTFLKVDHKFDSLRSDPRFIDLLRRVGL